MKIRDARILVVGGGSGIGFAVAEAAQGDEALARVIFTDSLFGGSARWVAAETADRAFKPTCRSNLAR